MDLLGRVRILVNCSQHYYLLPHYISSTDGFLFFERYEGTVWDDMVHGKDVYVAERGLVSYEGEWLQINMEGHRVVEVEIPNIELVPGSKSMAATLTPYMINMQLEQ